MIEFKENENKFIYSATDLYENSHSQRIDFLIKDLQLDTISNSTIVDFGCNRGSLINKLSTLNKNNNFVGIDFFDHKDLNFKYYQTDFDYPFSDNFLAENNKADYAFCFEVCEHIPNLYGFIYEIKKILKPDGILYLSIPHESVTHNTFYPGLFYPVNNFYEFLLQMAFEITDLRYHNKQFAQNVFSLVNKDWSHSKMRWYKSEEKFRNVSPLVAINL